MIGSHLMSLAARIALNMYMYRALYQDQFQKMRGLLFQIDSLVTLKTAMECLLRTKTQFIKLQCNVFKVRLSVSLSSSKYLIQLCYLTFSNKF